MKIKDYIELNDKSEIDFALKYSNVWNMPVNRIGMKELSEYSFGMVKDMQYDLDKGNLHFYKALDYFDKMGLNLDVEIGHACQSFNYLIQQIGSINEIEKELLSGSVKNEFIEAGIDELNELGIYLQIRQIAITLHYSIDQVKAMPYNEALLELITQKRIADFEERVMNARKLKS